MSKWDKLWEGREAGSPYMKSLKAEGDKLQRENKKLEYENYINYEMFMATALDVDKKLEAVGKILIDACETYNDGMCQNDCDCDPNGYEGCYTRKILGVLGE